LTEAVAVPTTTPPIALVLVPGLLRARGLEVGLKRLGEALSSGAIPGRRAGVTHEIRASILAG
jgi:hypothetical protein